MALLQRRPRGVLIDTLLGSWTVRHRVHSHVPPVQPALLGGFNYLSEKCEFVTWDDEIPNVEKKHDANQQPDMIIQ